MALEKSTSETVKREYLDNYDLVDDMFTYFVERLISIVKYKRRSSENVPEKQVQEWVKKLLKFKEHGNKYVQSVTLEWIMMKATTELHKEIDIYLSKK